MSTPRNEIDLVWIGLFGVVPKEGYDLLDGASGAYVNAVAVSAKPNDFCLRVTAELDEMGFAVEESDDIELITDRLMTHEIDSDLQDLAKDAASTGSVLFGTFHTFED